MFHRSLMRFVGVYEANRERERDEERRRRDGEQTEQSGKAVCK